MDTSELVFTALRGVGIYAIVLFIIRMTGKRTIGNFTAFDLLVALMLGEVVDEIIYGDVSLLQGLVALAVIALAHVANSWLSYWDHGFDAILEGTPTVIVKNGKLQRKGMRKERMNEKEVFAELRLNGIDDLREVKLAIVENDGEVSVIRQEWAEPLEKRNLKGRAATRGAPANEEPPPGKKTDSPEAISG